LYFYFFIGQQFRAGQAMNSTPAAIPVRWWQGKKELHLSKKLWVGSFRFVKLFGWTMFRCC
jgi:hypothetical protein